jgi:hypothetical protein
MKNTLLVNGLGIVFLFLITMFHYEAPATTEDIVTSPDCASKKGFAKILCLTDALKSTLKEDQLALLQLDYSKQNASKWSNFPASFRNAQRVGLNLGQMSPDQIKATFALLKEVAGTAKNEGLDELQQLLEADDYLNENGGGKTYGTANYFIAFLGKPATKGVFEIQFGGHHLAFANTYQDGVLTGATPSFRGVEPSGTFTWKGKSNQPLNQEQATLSEMLKGLSETQLASARLNQGFSDILVGPQRDGRFPENSSGIKCSSLIAAQKKLVINSIKTYVYDVDDKNAGNIMKRYIKELDSTYISYSGTPELTNRNDYVRLDGPSLWIEYSCQGGIIIRGITHPHSVWRDKLKDYGGN